MEISGENKDLPLRATMCPTCPFKPGSKNADLIPFLTERSMTDASHICHSTGKDNAFHKDTGLPEHICRGAREVQLTFFHRLGFLDEPTMENWNKKRVEGGMPPQLIQDPQVRRK